MLSNSWNDRCKQLDDECKAVTEQLAGKRLLLTTAAIGTQLSEIDRKTPRADACRSATDAELAHIVEWAGGWAQAAANEQGTRLHGKPTAEPMPAG